MRNSETYVLNALLKLMRLARLKGRIYPRLLLKAQAQCASGDPPSQPGNLIELVDCFAAWPYLECQNSSVPHLRNPHGLMSPVHISSPANCPAYSPIGPESLVKFTYPI
jgi:hypothetical protein